MAGEMEHHPSFHRATALGLLKTLAESVLRLIGAALALWVVWTFGVKHHG